MNPASGDARKRRLLHVLGLAEAAHRRAPADLAELVLVEAVRHLGAQVAGSDGVDRDPARAELARQRRA